MFDVFVGTNAMAHTLVWTLYLLTRHPEIAEKIKNEPNDSSSYIDCVINESHRFYPPFWGSTRFSKEHINIDGYTFPPKSTFLAIRYFSQHDPTYWDKPNIFNPDRFIDQNKSTNQLDTLLPFGTGSRRCLGVHLSPLFCKKVLFHLSQNVELAYSPDSSIKVEIDFKQAFIRKMACR